MPPRTAAGLTSPPVYPFTPFSSHPARRSVKLHFLSGVSFPALLSLLWRYRAHLDWRYAHRLAFLLCLSLFTAAVSLFEWLWFGARIAHQPLHPSPLFILGHPRTGTTHLHNLLSRDNRWAFATTWQVGFPSTCLLLSPFRRLLSPLLSKTRPMDGMALGWDLPAEDEIATCCLSAGRSPYMALVFPRASRIWGPLFDFSDAPASDAAAWEAAFLSFCRKVTFAASRGAKSGPKPLLLKSPVHTARVATLRGLFPGARFVYAHRHPLEVFASAAWMAESYYSYTFLQPPVSALALQEFILSQGELLFSAYARQAANLRTSGGGRLLAEVAFEELDRVPSAALARLYSQLGGLGEFRGSAVEKAVVQYAATLVGFRKNDHARLRGELEAVVRRRWAVAFDADGGYTQWTTVVGE
jgi:hypothetical protein